MTWTLLVLPAVVACFGVRATAADTTDAHIQLLRTNGLEPVVASLRQFLRSLIPSEELEKRQTALIKQLGDVEFGRREAALAELLRMPAVSRPLLQQAVDGDDPEIRWRSQIVLKRADSQDAARQRDELLFAVFAVIHDKTLKGLTEPALAAVPFCREKRLQRIARDAIRTTAEPPDADLLRGALRAESAPLRIAALVALERLLSKKAEADLLPLLEDEDDHVCIETAWVLANQGSRKCLPTLARLLDSNDFSIRLRSAHTLRELTGKQFSYAAYRPKDRRVEAAGAWRAWIEQNAKTAKLKYPIHMTEPMLGRTLVCFRKGNRVIELNAAGEKVWEVQIPQPTGCQGLLNGHRLIASYSGRMVVEYDASGKEVWRKQLHCRPFSVRRLENGSTLIAGSSGNGFLEVRPGGKSTRWKALRGEPMDARRLDNGHTLVALQKSHKVVEVDQRRRTVWEVLNMSTPRSAQRLKNGNTLVSQTRGGKVVELDAAGRVVWSQAGLKMPMDSQRLSNGHTLIAESRGALEVDRGGQVVWSFKGEDASAICRF